MSKKKNPKKKKVAVIDELTVDQRVDLLATDYDLVLQSPSKNLKDSLIVNKLDILEQLTNDQSPAKEPIHKTIDQKDVRFI
jgi:hypothetical protein